jgi:hypothetical protein
MASHTQILTLLHNFQVGIMGKIEIGPIVTLLPPAFLRFSVARLFSKHLSTEQQ